MGGEVSAARGRVDDGAAARFVCFHYAHFLIRTCFPLYLVIRLDMDALVGKGQVGCGLMVANARNE